MDFSMKRKNELRVSKKEPALAVRRKDTQPFISANHKKENELLQMEMQALMKKFLYEIHKQLRSKKITRSGLANHLAVSEAYLSQIFHSKKPLTFKTLAKCQRALHIDFEIRAKVND
jgi:YesN/AraC family two-component response regulator